jgi:putative addiction module component (TIGR02574 family)
MTIDIADLRNLTISEKLRIVTQLWDDIAASREPIVVPPEVLREALRRSDELKADPSMAIDEDELWRRVDGIFHASSDRGRWFERTL